MKNKIQELVDNNGMCSFLEYEYILNIITKKTPCNVLVFGVGVDSLIWEEANVNGKTVFLEHNIEWIKKIKESNNHLDIRSVSYWTKRRQWKKCLNNVDKLMMKLDDDVYDTEWDIIFIDAPTGYGKRTIGRMQSIYTSSKLKLKPNCDIIIHDFEREVENIYAHKFFKNKVNEFEQIGHFIVTGE